MIWYWSGLLLVLHVYLWGWGLTWLIVPRRWRPFWPAFCAPVGLALQSAVVWVGTHTALPGTDSYARASLALPVGLLAAAVAVRRPAGAWRLVAALRRWWAVALVMAFSLVLQTYPFTRPPWVLTSIAMTSCDAADYAAGARVFKEFAHGDRTGFLGTPELVRQLTVDNFFDFWLRINHFSPSAIISLDASVFHREPYELVTLMGVILLTLHLPGVFWLARSAFRFGPVAGLAVTAIYGVSPALFYAMYQVALGQLLAAPAIVLLTWAGLQAFREAGMWRRCAGYCGLMLVGDWLLLGSYNFFVVFAYLPLIGYVGVHTLVWGRWKRTLRWAAFVGLNLLVASLFCPGRVISLWQRFFLFNNTPFGWPIPGFYPAGWYGVFADVYLHPGGSWWLPVMGCTCLGALVWSVVRRGRRDARTALLAGACTLPIFFGYWLLLREEQRLHDNASYNAYKLFTVFYPGILASLCLWLRADGRTGVITRIGTTILWVCVLAANLTGDARFNTFVRTQALRVDPPLVAISRLEKLSAVGSVNVLLPRYWDRLWANALLLRKPQFFTLPNYEGRLVTAPLGQWDLVVRQHFILAHHDGEQDLLSSNPRFRLLDRRDPRFLTVELGTGWFPVEHDPGTSWCWAAGSPGFVVTNPHEGNVDCILKFTIFSLNVRTLRLFTGQRCWFETTVGPTWRTIDRVPVTVSPGTTVLRFDTPEPAAHAPGDSRPLTFDLQGLEIDVPPTH